MEIEYSRPGVKDRVIFGELVPYGKLWRTGANATTTISFSEDVTISGNKLKAGEYSIFTIPHEKRIKVIFNSDAEAREGSYDESRNAATIDVPLEDARENVERMRFTFENVEDASVDLTFSWAGKSFAVPITMDTHALVEARMEEKLREGDQPYNFYHAAAGYYLDRDVKRAVKYAEKSTEMEGRYWNVTTLARAYAAAGDKDSAIKAAEWGARLAEEGGSDYYIQVNKEIMNSMK